MANVFNLILKTTRIIKTFFKPRRKNTAFIRQNTRILTKGIVSRKYCCNFAKSNNV